MYRIAITHENEDYAITYGRKEDVDKAVSAEEQLYPNLEVLERDCENLEDLEEELTQVRSDYVTASVLAV